VGKIAEKAVCRSVFLITWHYNLSAELIEDCFLAIYYVMHKTNL